MFIAALFTIARAWKQPKSPSTEKWIKMWRIHTVEYYSAIQKNKIIPFAVIWMGLEMVILSKLDRKINITSLTCGNLI